MRSIIIDDEKSARENLKRCLNSFSSDIQIIEEAENVAAGLEVIKNQEPELVFLDVEMPDGSGFDLLANIEHIDFKIIFTTAHQKYAIDAFKFSAIHYILKPIDPEELQKAIQKAKEEINKDFLQTKVNILLNNLNPSQQSSKKLVLKESNSIHVLQIEDVLRIEASDNYTIFYPNDGQQIVVSKTLKEFEKLLKDEGFFRIHQSHLINLNALKKYEGKVNGGIITMSDGSQVPISKRKKDRFLAILENI